MMRLLVTAVLILGVEVAGAAQEATSQSDPLSHYRVQAQQQWEAEIVKLEEQDRTDRDPGEAILFIGSSSIRLWKDLAADVAPRPTVNRGYGGARFSDLAVFVERIVAPHACQAIVVFVANDIVGKPDDKSPQEVARLFQYIVDQIRKTHASQPIFLIAITPTPSRFSVWPEIRQANAELEKVCAASKSLHFIATERHYLDERGQPLAHYFVEDQLHLNREGYRVWAGLVKESLDKVLGAPTGAAK